MFTGIVNHLGVVDSVEARGDDGHGTDRRMTFQAPSAALMDAREGDSMSVSGACLTMLDISEDRFSADVSAETLDKTTLGRLQPGDEVNLEAAMRLQDRLGGHLVSGHVDGVARLQSRQPDGASERFRFRVPQQLQRYLAPKGSVCIDGVSLTVNEVEGNEFEVCIIPHTLEVTTLGALQEGQGVNIEMDLIARYIDSLLANQTG